VYFGYGLYVIAPLSSKEVSMIISKRKFNNLITNVELPLVKRINLKDNKIQELQEHINKLESFTTEELMDHNINKYMLKMEGNYEDN
jgi:hypothetical protein